MAICTVLLGIVGWKYLLVNVLVTTGWTQQPWSALLLGLLVLHVVRPLLLWPLSVISVFIGYRFGAFTGLPLALLGTVITCLPPFLLASQLNTTDGYVASVAERAEHLVDATGELQGMIAARLSPAPADVISYVSSLGDVSLKTFVIGTLVGELPWNCSS